MTDVNNIFVTCEFKGLMNFDCETCGEVVHIPITASKDEEYRCGNCSRTYVPREGLRLFNDKFPDIDDVIDQNDPKYQMAKEEFENGEIDKIDFNTIKTTVYNEQGVEDFYTTCDYEISGGATMKKGKKLASVQYGGRTRISGVDNVEAAREFAEFIADKFEDGELVDLYEPTSYNISKELDYGLVLNPLSNLLKTELDNMYQVEYEPENFPGIIAYYNHGFKYTFGDEVIEDSIDNTSFNVVSDDQFILRVDFTDNTISDNTISSVRDSDAYTIDIKTLLGSDVVDVESIDNDFRLELEDGSTVNIDVDIDDKEVVLSGLEKDIKIKRISTNLLLYSSNKVVINTPELQLAERTFAEVKKFINEKSTGISEVPTKNGTEKRYLFKEQKDRSELKEQMRNLPDDI